MLWVPTTYVFVKKLERYQHFSDEKKTPNLLLHVCRFVKKMKYDANIEHDLVHLERMSLLLLIIPFICSFSFSLINISITHFSPPMAASLQILYP